MATSFINTAADFDDEEIDFSDFEDFLSDPQRQEREEGGSVSVCICGLPSTEQVIKCSKQTCKVIFFHAPCVGLTLTGDLHGEWFCEDCVESDDKAHPNPACQANVEETASSSSSSHPRTSKVKMKYPPKKFGKVDAAAKAKQYTQTVLDGVFSAPLFSMETPLTGKVKDLTRNVQSSFDHEQAEIYFKKLTGKLWKKVASVVRGQQWTEECITLMWQGLHQLRYNQKLLKGWKNLLDTLNIARQTEEEVFMFQYLLQEIFKLLMQDMMEKDLPILITPLEAVPMDENEEQALRYCTGYVPKKLIKHYNTQKKSETAASFVQVLRGWSVTDETDLASSLLEFTTVWLQKQNRGGLFIVNDNVYAFFKEMEMVVRGCLHQKNIGFFQNTDIQVTLFNCLLNSRNVMDKWEPLADSLPKGPRRKLCEEVIKSFLKMRCEAFVRVYMMVRKKEDALVSKRGDKGLRKELAK